MGLGAEAHDALNYGSAQRLLEDIENYKSELERRPGPEQVGFVTTHHLPRSAEHTSGRLARGNARV